MNKVPMKSWYFNIELNSEMCRKSSLNVKMCVITIFEKRLRLSFLHNNIHYCPFLLKIF